MEAFMNVLLWIAVAIMLNSIISFLRSRKVIKNALVVENKGIKGVLSSYFILLIFFAAAYVFYALTWSTQNRSGVFELLVPAILFWGAVFVYITMFFIKILVKDLIEARLNQLDSLTGVLNKEAIRHSITRVFETTKEGHALILMDLDNFKEVNDRYGHMEGDDVIRGVAKTIRNHVRPEDLVGRFGGDEFVALIRNVDMQEAKRIAEKLNQEILEFCHGKNLDLELSASMGIAYREKDAKSTYDELFERADRAMYHSKQNGKNCVTSECK